MLWLGVLCWLLCESCASDLLVREDLREIATGAGSPMDPGALELIRHGAQHSEPEALYLFAMLKLYGHGVQQNTQEAVLLLKQAADLSHRDAEFAIGVLYGRGDKGKQCVDCPLHFAHLRFMGNRSAQERPHERCMARCKLQPGSCGRQVDAGHVSSVALVLVWSIR